MRKIILLLICLIPFTFLFSQANTFPTNGNTGIGTSTPAEKLQVIGGKIFVGTPTIIDSYDQLYSAGSNPGFRQEVQRGSGGAVFDLANLYAHKTSAAGDALWGKLGVYGDFGVSGIAGAPIVSYMYFGSEPTVSYSNNTFRLYPNKTAYFNGNIGIGTTVPGQPLEIYNSSPLIRYNRAGGYSWEAGVGNGTNIPLSYFAIRDISANNVPFVIAYSTGNIGVGLTTPTEKLDVNGNIYTNGKILIGTAGLSTGSYSLAVNGSAIFTKAIVKLSSAWPDYVFFPDYKVTPLDSLEQFIQLNKHLPDVPSADEVQKDGVDLGDNQALLLKKIEELTLIVIEQNKRIEQLEKEHK